MKKIKWNVGDVFCIKLLNNKNVIGQIIDLQMANVVCCTFYKQIFNPNELENISIEQNQIISFVACTREQLDYGVWPILGNKKIFTNKLSLPNEQYRNNSWIGAITYDASIIEEFVNTYNGLLPWDDWANHNNI